MSIETTSARLLMKLFIVLSGPRAFSARCCSVCYKLGALLGFANRTIVCPNCSNMLTVARAPTSANVEDNEMAGRNRFECRSCPYAYLLTQPFFERKDFKAKQADEIVGGQEAMKNANKTTSKSLSGFVRGDCGDADHGLQFNV